MSGERASRYRFGPRERGGGLAGWRTGQIVTVAMGLVFGVLVLRWEPNAVGVAAAWLLKWLMASNPPPAATTRTAAQMIRTTQTRRRCGWRACSPAMAGRIL